MRIVLVSDSYPPLIGGATRATQLLADGLYARGHEVDVLTAWQAGAAAEEIVDGVSVHRIEGLFSTLWRRFRPDAIATRFTPPSIPDPVVAWRTRRLLRKQKPDVIVAYGWLSYSVWFAARWLDIKFVLSLRDYGNVCALRTLLHDGRPCSGPSTGKCLPCAADTYGTAMGSVGVASVLGQRPLLRRRLAGLHSCSHYVEDIAREHLLRGKPIRTAVIPDYSVAIDIDGPRPPGLPDEPFILYVGAFRRVKGIEVLLEAYGRLADPPPLVLIGTPSPDPMPPLPAGAVVLGPVAHSSVLAAWAGGALFGVAPSIWAEPLGNVAHEALSRGVPMIGSTVGGHGEMIVDGVNGLLVANGDVDALTAAMRLLLDDADFRRRLSQASTASAGRFTEAIQLPAWEKFLEDVVSGTPA